VNRSSLPTTDFTETTVTERIVFQGRLLAVREDTVGLPDGGTALREYVVHPGAVLIIAIQDDGRVVLERQFRYPLRRHLIELPAGRMERDEEPMITAQRELLEEAGYHAREWRHLGTTHSCVGYSDERIELFLARGLTPRPRSLEEGEFIDVFELPLDDALDLIDSGEITDAKTIAGLLWLSRIDARARRRP
jgi:ADP-ribose pyrophosphatase